MSKKIRLFAMLLALLMFFVSCGSDNAGNGTTGNKSTSDRPASSNHETYYTVTFKTNGGSSVSSKTVSKLESAPSTTKQQHLFEGWYLDEGLTIPVIFPLTLNSDTTLYAGWLRTQKTEHCVDTSIKDMSDDHPNSAIYYVTPQGFDYDKLEKAGFSQIKITAKYDVSYKKVYNAPFDIGYFGSPEYNVSILTADNIGAVENDVKTPEGETLKKEISKSCKIADLKNSSLRLCFSTENIQNIVYIKNIYVYYECIK